MSDKRKIAEAVVVRLSIYNRALGEIEKEGLEIISSDELGDDLSFFGEFGEVGKGYFVQDLRDVISHILGVDRKWNVALAGAGHLGSALLAYPGFKQWGFNIVAVFDNDLAKIGKKWESVVIQDISELAKTVKEQDIRIGAIAVPPQVSQEIVDMFMSYFLTNEAEVRSEVLRKIKNSSGEGG